VWHFFGEATEDLTHADSRLWRTLLALLVKPGFLTREFIEGRRASYLPPVRLYLVLSVMFFLLAASGGGGSIGVIGAAAPDDAPPKVVVSSITERSIGGEAIEQSQQLCERIPETGRWSALLRRSCIHSVQDRGRSLKEAFFHALPRAMFLFLPLIAAMMALLYWSPRHYYVEHLLLLLHNHAFVFLIVIITWVVERALPSAVSSSRPAVLLRLAVQIYIAIYIYRSMRQVYGQGALLTNAKFLVMSFVYGLSAVVMLALTVLYSALAL